jgi:hypothetical protein
VNRKYRNTFRRITVVTAAAVLASVAVLWSWNTLAPLFGGPPFEFRHAVAFLIALVVLRVVLRRGVGRRRHEAEPEMRS